MNLLSHRITREMMNLNKYQSDGIKRLVVQKGKFVPFNFNENGENEKQLMDSFINTFCEYQLADNDYMNIEFHSEFNNATDYYQMSLEKILKHITHIIWTDKAIPGYFATKVKDNTIYHLLNRLERLELEKSIRKAAN